MGDELDGILRELSEIQEKVIGEIDFEERARRQRQDQLRAEAGEARSGLVDHLSLNQLRDHLAHLQQLGDEHLGTRPSASAAAQTGQGGGIDPQYLREMNRKMAATSGLDELAHEINVLPDRIRSLARGQEEDKP